MEEDSDIHDCYVCDAKFSSMSDLRNHVKICKNLVKQRWKSNSQVPTGLNLNQFINDHPSLANCMTSTSMNAERKVNSMLELPDIDFECPICLKDANTIRTKVFRTKCDHLFCAQCIKRWLEITPYCPQCRKPQQKN